MRSPKFISSREGTEQPAAFPAMVTNRATYFSHCDSVRENKKDVDEGEGGRSFIGVPDL